MHKLSYIRQHTNLPEIAIKNTVSLLNEDATIPFIARYRKELTGNLDEVQIGAIVKYNLLFEELEKRKNTILKTLKEQEVLTPTLAQQIKFSKDLISLEDLYLPYKKKRKTKAENARILGLEPLAKLIMSQNITNLKQTTTRFITKDVLTAEAALQGAQHIIAEWINERPNIRQLVRQQITHFGTIKTTVIKVKKDTEKAKKYTDYFNWEEPLKRIPSHRLLAIFRAESEGILSIKVTVDTDKILHNIAQKIIKPNSTCRLEIQTAIKDAYKRLLYPSLSNECLASAKELADAAAITVFSKNLKQLLLSPPLGEKKVLAIDPGFKSGCKIVCLNALGGLEHNETIYPHAPQKQTTEAIKKISFLVASHQIEAIAIGNGTASRETEQLVQKIQFKNSVAIFVVSEAGASVYSASKIAREEFPNFDVTVRGAVSIGRRLQDPLAELVKIDAKSIGVGQYQHDVDQLKLKTALDNTVMHCVNTVGVNINSASAALLSYVSGTGPKLAENIINYRTENGAFTSRQAIKNVPRLGNKAFEQAAGFLRIKEATYPLDNSAVHPESYALVNKMAKDLNINISNLIGNTALIKQLQLKNYITKTIGLPTLKDIVSELEKPGLDPRPKAKVFSFDKNITKITDLQAGKILPGIVNNITNFGCFVDIGIKESGLIHVSNLSDTFVKDVSTIVTLQQHITVKVLEVDVVRKRIQLALIK